MANRVTAAEVQEIITLKSTVTVATFITAANLITNQVSDADSDGKLTAAELKEIERYLAAHFASHEDQRLEEKRTDDASGKSQGKTGMFFEGTFYGQTAMLLDCTGKLNELQEQAEKGASAKLFAPVWLGTEYT